MHLTKSGPMGERTAQSSPETALAEAELEAINSFAKTALTEEEVFTFSVLLCDNEVDRDFERFSEATLGELQALFVGKTGIADHDWSSKNQVARLYRTELVTEEKRKNSLGMPYRYVKGFAYMLRTEQNAQTIAEIQGGIKRETSIGCAVASRICSICGRELGAADCGHIPGREYEGKLCFGELRGAVDAYEWSFVAVPAQRQAGVMKGFGQQLPDSLKAFVEKGPGAIFAGEYARLEAEAALGRKYMDGLRREVLRLCLVCDEKLYHGLESGSRTMNEGELLAVQAAMQEAMAKKMPLQTQLPGRAETTAFDDSAYRV